MAVRRPSALHRFRTLSCVRCGLTLSSSRLSKTQGRGEAIFTKAQAVLAHELTASGVHGEEAAFAVATVLFHLGGFIVLEDALSPDYRVRGAEVWAQGTPRSTRP